MRSRVWFRFVTWLAVACLLSACASIKNVEPGAPFEKRELHDRYVLHLRDGRSLTTNHITVTDSTFVLHTLVEDGKDRAIEPMAVRRSDVESMQRTQRRYLLVAGVLAGIAVGVMLLAKAIDIDYE